MYFLSCIYLFMFISHHHVCCAALSSCVVCVCMFWGCAGRGGEEQRMPSTALVLAKQRSLARKQAVPELKPGTMLWGGVLTYTIAKDQDPALKGGEGRIYIMHANEGKLMYAGKVGLRKRSKGTEHECQTYFAINPEECLHLALLNDVVPHPGQPGTPILVTEFAQKGSLKKWVKKNLWPMWRDWDTVSPAKRERVSKMTLPGVLAISIQMLRGLHSLHEQGMKHQDVKLDNLLVFDPEKGMPTATPFIKLADFGMTSASAEEREGEEGEGGGDGERKAAPGEHVRVGGTRLYMPPEQAALFVRARRGEAVKSTDVVAAFDLWASGLVFAQLVSPATKRAVEEYHDWVRSAPFKEAIPEMAAKAQSIVVAAEAEAARAAEESKKEEGGTMSGLGKCWELIVKVLRVCLGSDRAMDATAKECERELQKAYRLVSKQGSRFKPVRPSSTQFRYAMKLFHAFRPREREVGYNALLSCACV